MLWHWQCRLNKTFLKSLPSDHGLLAHASADLCGFLDRLARWSLYLAGRNQSGSGDIDLTQSELAQHLGVSREKVSRNLSDWRDDGWIETRRASISILERAPLLALGDVQT